MNLATKWSIRQIAITYLMSVLSFTTVGLFLCGFRFYKFMCYGANYFGHVPPGTPVERLLWAFYEYSIEPIMVWLPVLLLLDIALRKFVPTITE